MKFTFITGGAGTGKSFTLRKMLEEETRPFVVCAPTGLAAMNVGGVTIHNGFKIDINGFVRDSVHKAAVRLAEVVYVDEVSMVSDKLMDSMFESLDRLGMDIDIVAFGDLAQLKPVQDSYFFAHKQPDEIIKLEKNYRQADDLTFANILNNIRQGKIVRDEITWINEKATYNNMDFIALAFSNADVEKINLSRLQALWGDAYTFDCEIQGNFNPKDCSAPEELTIKVGARVMMLNNDRTNRWQNGTRATVKAVRKDAFGDNTIDVELDNANKNVYTIKPHTWTKEEPIKLTESARRKYETILDEGDSSMHDLHRIRKILRTGIDYLFVGSFTQFPMKLAYASTVHKAQGQTMQSAHVIPDGFGNMHGLAYVALSRLTSIEGLSLSRKLNLFDFKFDRTVRPYL